ncbi:hypothetical protein [Aegicerativicinus sediminis]|uniref:hypothetical protein n=1 Tax=Aegicerativicinus sediminis TaxID=2893202 RepID=UPI001E600EE6|nr:hypothetical protein [Aegicerativicinus sediminis]
MSKLLLFLLFLISPLILIAAVIVSPLYFGFKIFDRAMSYQEAKKGYNKPPENPLMSMFMPFVKNAMTPKK